MSTHFNMVQNNVGRDPQFDSHRHLLYKKNFHMLDHEKQPGLHVKGVLNT